MIKVRAFEGMTLLLLTLGVAGLSELSFAQDPGDLGGISQDVQGGIGETLEGEVLEGEFLVEGGEALEGAISGTEYRLGPGDVLAISVWGPQSSVYQLGVTLEGNLLIPTVGEVDVNDLLLSNAKEVIRRAVLRVYHTVDVSITLIKLRRFQVHVLGQVRNPGTFLATAVDRVSFAVARARGFGENASRRRITVFNGDSLRAEADLYSFAKLGTVEKNPVLKDGDKVFVPFSNEHVEIRGEVNAPGIIQLLEGDRLSDLLFLAAGFTREAFTDTLEVARYPEGTTTPVRFFVGVGGGLVSASPLDAPDLPHLLPVFVPAGEDTSGAEAPLTYSDFELKADDIVFVRSQPEFARRKLVEIRGEVVYPGNYAIREGESRVSDLIDWAGGVTKEAGLAEARLLRRETAGLPDKEFERLKLLTREDMDEEEYSYFKMKSRAVVGKMVMDFEKALKGDPQENLFLRRGDLIVIPLKKEYVNVLGMVSFPGNVIYRPGLKAGDYVNLTGGYAEDADKGDARVIKGEGGEWKKFGDAGELDPGDVVFIPEKSKGQFWSTLQDALTISVQILTVYLVADRAIN